MANDYGEPTAGHKGEVVHAIHTQTSVFVSPEGEHFPYLNVECFMGDGEPGPNLLFNGGLTIGILDAITKYLATMFGVDGQTTDMNQMQLEFDQPIDWDNLAPPPDDPFQPPEEPDPDRRHDG